MKSTNSRDLPFSVLGAHSCQGLDGQIWTAAQGLDGCQGKVSSWAPVNGANKSNDDEDAWDDTRFSTCSELNTIAANENDTENRVRTGTYCVNSRKTGTDVRASRIHTQGIDGVGVCRTDPKLALYLEAGVRPSG